MKKLSFFKSLSVKTVLLALTLCVLLLLAACRNPAGNSGDSGGPGGPNLVVELNEHFDTNMLPADWSVIDADSDTYNWDATRWYDYKPHLGHGPPSIGMISSASFVNGVGALTPDNYLVTPELDLSGDGMLSFWVRAQDPGALAEHYAVYASAAGNTESDFRDTTPLLEETLAAGQTWFYKEVMLPAGTKYVALRHFNCTNHYWLNIDDVMITADSDGSVKLNEHFDSGTLPQYWSTIDGDGDGYNWNAGFLYNAENSQGHGTSIGMISSASSIIGVGALNPDNYLVTPELDLPGGGRLYFWVSAQDNEAFSENYTVYASQTGNTAADFTSTTPIWDEQLEKGWVWFLRSVMLPAGTRYVAFRHHNCSDQFWLNIDDVVILKEED